MSLTIRHLPESNVWCSVGFNLVVIFWNMVLAVQKSFYVTIPMVLEKEKLKIYRQHYREHGSIYTPMFYWFISAVCTCVLRVCLTFFTSWIKLGASPLMPGLHLQVPASAFQARPAPTILFTLFIISPYPASSFWVLKSVLPNWIYLNSHLQGFHNLLYQLYWKASPLQAWFMFILLFSWFTIQGFLYLSLTH